MHFRKGDSVVVLGTRYDGRFGTVVSRAATNGWYKVKVTTDTVAEKLVVLRGSSLSPTVSTEKATLSFIRMLNGPAETAELASALGIPYAVA